VCIRPKNRKIKELSNPIQIFLKMVSGKWKEQEEGELNLGSSPHNYGEEKRKENSPSLSS
jgi:hypothetical protein